MRLTDIKYWANLLTQVVEGKTLQFLNISGDWCDVDADGNYSLIATIDRYRIKPTEPILRPWKPEEVPVGALIRVKVTKYLDGLHIQMILYICPCGVTLSARNGHMECEIKELASTYEHSSDHGKTWLPCGVME